MAKSTTSFKPGSSGNPKGRPPKERALTTLLENAGIGTIEYNGKNIERREALAEILWEAAIRGRVTFADGKNDVLNSGDWITIVKFLYATIDPPRKELDVTSGGEAISTISLVEIVRPPTESE